MHTDIKVRSFTGRSLKPYLAGISRLRSEILREYPYLYEGELVQGVDNLDTLLQHDASIAVIVFDGSTIVGASTGQPLEYETDVVHKPFTDLGLDPSAFFYFGKSFLLKPYRSRGIGHHFFDLREEHVARQLRFQHICFSTIEHLSSDVKKPSDYLSLENFWRKRGYVQRGDLSYSLFWQDIHATHETEKNVVFWIKDLP
jgi:hypothetical protein